MAGRKRVCVIGAGSSGIIALQELVDAGLDAVAYESRPHVGGQWHLDGDPGECLVTLDEQGRATLLHPDENGGNAAPSPPTAMYRGLRTNVPTPLFSDSEAVEDYLKVAAKPLLPLSHLNTRVTSVRWTAGWTADSNARKWTVETTSTTTGTTTSEQYDSVVVANGHFSQPLIPDLDVRRYTGTLSHARWYRDVEPYRTQNVLVIGNGSSGYDITREIAMSLYDRLAAKDPTAEGLFIAQSTRSPSPIAFPFTGSELGDYSNLVINKPTVERVESKTVWFSDGTSLENVDTIIFATGYYFSFPFANPSHEPFASNPLTIPVPFARDNGGHRIHHLDERQLFYLPDPTLSFLATQILVVPFPLAQVQAR
ncbi:dimethylaniline monooxygenase (N-oxide forming) [Pseudohyphozyma bogoriensis]|nr:dimethylaniline monooxygenase (N-oxide forming) [Pseudohyphozyma bogoriensis]